MNVRCYLHDTKEFYYPESNEPRQLSEFYGVLEGYRLKGRVFELTWGLDFKDVEDREVFAGDRVELIYPPDRNKKMFPLPVEKGIVVYNEGCFTFISEDFPGHERVLSSDYSVRVLNYAYANL